MESNSRVLIIEDDKYIQNFISLSLKTNGYIFDNASTGMEGISLFYNNNPDIVLLDLGLPDIDGNEVIKLIRTISDIPILVVSARGQENEKIAALDAGADDYITKPFGIMELVSRVKALLRRSATSDKNTSITYENVELNIEKHCVTVDNQICELTYKEFELLRFLLENQGIVLSRDKIMERVWGFDYEGETRTVDMHIKTLRQKLGDSGAMIKTVRNVGYKVGE